MLTRLLAALRLPHRHDWRVTYTDDDECALPGCTMVRLYPGGVVTRTEATRRAEAAR
jgi:hypothetical protein